MIGRSLRGRTGQALMPVLGLLVFALGVAACDDLGAGPIRTPVATGTPVPTLSATPSPSPRPSPTPSPTSVRSPGSGTPPPTPSPTPEPTPVSGSVSIGEAAGADPLLQSVLTRLGPGVNASVSPADDFGSFCAGTLDAYVSGRALDFETDAPTCVKNGVDWIEMKIARNAVVVASPASDQSFACLQVPDLYAALGPESNGIDNWKAATKLSNDVGSDSLFDPLALAVIGPPPDAAASRLLLDDAIKAYAVSRGQPVQFRADYAQQPDAAGVINALSAAPAGTIGWLSFADAQTALDRVRPLSIFIEDGCVDASSDKVATGVYPLFQTLYVYTSLASVQNGALTGLVDTFLDDRTQTDAQTLGYLPVTPVELDDSRFAWEGR